MPETPSPPTELWAWIGEDEFGSGVVGLKQARTAAGYVALVATERDKIDRPIIRAQLQHQARTFGKTIRLARFELAVDGVVTLHGHDA